MDDNKKAIIKKVAIAIVTPTILLLIFFLIYWGWRSWKRKNGGDIGYIGKVTITDDVSIVDARNGKLMPQEADREIKKMFGHYIGKEFYKLQQAGREQGYNFVLPETTTTAEYNPKRVRVRIEYKDRKMIVTGFDSVG